MKIFKYLLKPVKVITFFFVILALVYFRSIIFHNNVNQYIDIADSYIERTFDIVIPAYENEIIDDSNEKNISSNNDDEPVAIDDIEESVVDVKKGDKNINIASSDSLLEEAAPLETKKAGNASNLDENLNLIKKLSGTVESLSEKIDMLFEKNNNSVVKSPVKVKEVLPLDSKEVVESDVDSLSVDSNGKKNVDSDEDNAVVSNDAAGSDVRRLLFMARQTFWSGNPNGSEKLYLDLVGIEDSDPDVYGELGNVYYAQGKWKQAGKAYYEAAIRLLELKRNDQVGYLLRVIQGLDAESAEKLRNKLEHRKT
jgi:tetratricopeptide (TPR) repeat protein